MGRALIFLISITFIQLLRSCTHADILAASKLEVCEKSSEKQIQCDSKVVVTVTVVSGKSGDSNGLEVELPSLTAEDGVKKKLLEPYRLYIEKSDVSYNYPLSYLQTFNEWPREEIRICTNCKDDPEDDEPGCGWALDRNQRHILDSQGFCCRCRTKDSIPKFLGGTHQSARFKVKCNFFKSLLGKKNGSAHCLRFADSWFPTFVINEASLLFVIKITILRWSKELQGLKPIAEPMEISPGEPFKVSEGKIAKIRLQGDFATYTAAPQLYDRYLSIPNYVFTSVLQEDTFLWKAVEKNKYSVDGKECNKIGTSYTAFRYQADKCSQAIDSCLANSPRWYLDKDLFDQDNHRRPAYAISQYGNVKYLYNKRNKDPKDIKLKIFQEQTFTSVITLEFKTDKIPRYFVNRSPGKITSATIRDFEALSRNGRLIVEVKNIGTLTADFTITVTLCSRGILAPIAQQISLPIPEDNSTIPTLTFLLHTTDDEAVNRSCQVNLIDSLGDPTDQKNVSFITSATRYSNGSQDFASQAVLKNSTESGWGFGFSEWFKNFDLFGLLKFRDCSECALLNFPCFIINFCWSELVTRIGGIATTVMLCVGVYLLWSSGLLKPVLKLLCLPCRLCCNAKAKGSSRKDSSSDDYLD